MQFPEEDSPVLKEWIVKRLENTLVAPFLVPLQTEYADDPNSQI